VQNPVLCQRYMAAVVKNVKIGPSPLWMRERLRASGVRPISNIVDITNYVMLEYGHPMHAFDLENVREHKIVVRNAREGESIVTLDEVERKLSPEMLVIGDAVAPSAIAGVMGGELSGINDNTTTIVFESACFLGSSVRTTAKKVGLRTESSSRFEKGLDPRTCAPALARACQLVELLGIGEVVSGVIDVDNDKREPLRIPFDYQWINRFLGIDISRESMVTMLQTLDITVEGDTVIPPTYRADLTHKADIAEEIARLFGYNNIPTTALSGLAEGSYTPRQKFNRSINTTLLALGCTEIITYSFISPRLYDKLELPENSPLRNSVTILNPLGEDTSVMRTTALSSMLDILARNYNNRNPAARLFEIATEYIPTELDKQPIERPAVMLGCYGKNEDFFSLKGIVEELLGRLGVTGCEYTAERENSSFHPGRCAVITRNGKQLGILGEIHPKVAGNFGIDTRVYLARLDGNALYENRDNEKKYRPLPKFPASGRDLAVTCDEALPVAELEKVIRKEGGRLLEKLELFDVYRGTQIEQGKKSVAYSLSLRAADHTLTVEECDKVMANIFGGLEKLGAEIRR
ncbi:MAG: phenylalanine--tRNA ligase subunit beta, partial [Angelakisella sp.]